MQRISAALFAVLLAAFAARAQDDPFKGPTKVVEGPEGRVRITIPTRWREESISGKTGKTDPFF